MPGLSRLTPRRAAKQTRGGIAREHRAITDLAYGCLDDGARKLERIANRQPDVVPEPKIHSLALRIARVAQGQLDAAFAGKGAHDWDLAAADLLVQEAGGRLDVDSAPGQGTTVRMELPA